MNTSEQVITCEAFKIEVRNGKPVYILYGMLEVWSLDQARELLTDRRVTPRHAPLVLQAFKLPENVAPRGRGLLDKFNWE